MYFPALGMSTTAPSDLSALGLELLPSPGVETQCSPATFAANSHAKYHVAAIKVAFKITEKVSS